MCKVANLVTEVTSAFLSGIAIFGFGTLLLSLLAFLALAFVGLTPAVPGKLSFPRANVTDGILCQRR